LERSQKAIHLRTGDRATDGAVSAWLERHGVEVIPCADAFEACTVALSHSPVVPELAFVGADWLAPDEIAIVSYFRETWPGITIVIYGSASATAGFEATALTHVCRSAAAVRRMLAAPPVALLEESHRALRTQPSRDDDWRPRPDAPRANGHTAAGETLVSRSTSQTRDGAAIEADLTSPAGVPLETGAQRRPPVSQTILTKEELAALLNDEEK
jgi:hypothetical protein